MVFMLSTFLITQAMLEDYALSTAGETAELILQQTEKRLVSFFAELESQNLSIDRLRRVFRVSAVKKKKTEEATAICKLGHF
jgi:hypothetical protein